MQILSPSECHLIVIDIQEKLLAAMRKKSQIALNAQKLIQGVSSLNIPIFITEQYPKGLGPTTNEIIEVAGDFKRFEKTAFGCLQEKIIHEQLERSGKKQIIICGIEAHICVHQTAMQLIAAGYQVFLAADACGSRKKEDYRLALASMEEMGCRIGSSEMFLFELLQTSNNTCFKTIAAIIK